MSRKFSVITFLLAILGIILSLTAMVATRTNTTDISGNQSISDNQIISDNQSGDTQYVLYLGTNDKDTNNPVFSPEESMEKAKEILIKNFGGYTIQEASGGWIDGDQVYQEYTLVIYLSDTNIEQVHKACDELIKEFNQSSVLIQANETRTEFYAG